MTGRPKGQTTLPDAEFIVAFEQWGAHEMARRRSMKASSILARRRRLETKRGITISSPNAQPQAPELAAHPSRAQVRIEDGIVLVGSDAHYWPGRASTGHRAFVRFCRDMQPAVVIMNGDVLDLATISRHMPIGWETRPTVADEIAVAKERLGEIVDASPGARHIWPLGNHDARFETRLATIAPEFAKVEGVHLKDHFPDWEPCWSVWINDDVVVKHRYKGGTHATHNNTVYSGKTLVTGHLHNLRVTPFTDYNGTRWGVDGGCLADIYAPAFTDYMEDGPRNWRSGFIDLTFWRGRLLWPEIVSVMGDGLVDFRGQVMEIE